LISGGIAPGHALDEMSTRPFTKKRSAPDGGAKGNYQKNKFAKTGPTTSKPGKQSLAHSGKPSYTGKPAQSGKGKAPVKDESEVKRRKQPVTLGGGEVPDDEDEDMSGDDYADGDEMDVDEVEGVNSEGGNGEATEKRPRLSKAEKAALHAAQPHRTTLLPSHPLLQDKLLPLWETARRAEMPKDERKKAIEELWAAVKGRVGEISKGHKGGRVLQTVCCSIAICSHADGLRRSSSTAARTNGSVSRWSSNHSGAR
jgi:pumilio family protein 6